MENQEKWEEKGQIGKKMGSLERAGYGPVTSPKMIALSQIPIPETIV